MIFAPIRFAERFVCRWLFLSAITASIVSCGVTTDPLNVKGIDETDRPTLDYAAWCELWQLSCPTYDGMELPSWEVADVLEVLEGLIDSQYHLELGKELLFHPDTKAMAVGSGLGQPFEQLLQSLQKSGFERIAAAEGQATLATAEYITYTGTSGLEWTVSPEATMDLADIGDGVVALSGVATGSSQVSSLLERVIVGENFHTTLNFTDITVVGVPPAFFQKETGLNLPQGEDRDIGELMGNLGHPLRLLLRDNQIALDAGKLDMAANALRKSSSDPSVQSLAMIIEAVTEFTLGGVVPLSLRFVKKDAVQCRLSSQGVPDMEVTLASDVELRALTIDKEGVTTLSFSGMETRILIPGPIKPRLKLKQIELSKTHLTIRGIPVIGKLSVPYSNRKPRGFNVQCSEV